MTGPDPAVAATRRAVRPYLTASAGGALRPDPPERATPAAGGQPGCHVLVACSGGPDSLALAAAVGFEAARLGLRAGALVVDHGLQDGSVEVADSAAEQCSELGLDPVEVVRVAVDSASPGGLEAAARTARHAALESGAERLGASIVFLGHTLDDQAEQVLLGLARGSGARSLAGMPAVRGPFVRPFLGLTRKETAAACVALGLHPWQDPHNSDARFARTRARVVLADLERALGPGLSAALARSADLLRRDADALDQLASDAAQALGQPPWEVSGLSALPPAVRARVLRLLVRPAVAAAGAAPADVGSRHVAALDALVTAWRGQGPVALPGGVRVTRHRGRLHTQPPSA